VARGPSLDGDLFRHSPWFDMSIAQRIRLQRILREAEGYLELGLPPQALAALNRIVEPGTFNGQRLYLKGEALRALERYAEALAPLQEAVNIAPSNIHAWLALGWCFKRTDRLTEAIDALERAHDVDPTDALVQYNLACYYSLDGRKRDALDFLSQAIAGNPHYRDLVGEETDFDPIRSDPEFRSLVSVVV
jgi:tetratricopeptide (TPR) repeat protein